MLRCHEFSNTKIFGGKKLAAKKTSNTFQTGQAILEPLNFKNT
jgi:hypothetical protein